MEDCGCPDCRSGASSGDRISNCQSSLVLCVPVDWRFHHEISLWRNACCDRDVALGHGTLPELLVHLTCGLEALAEDRHACTAFNASAVCP